MKIFNINHFLKSFRFAFSGLVYVWKSEQSFRIQSFIAVAVVVAAIFLNFSFLEFALLSGVIVFVLAAESLNTALEKILDIVDPNWNGAIKIIKDISASVVLIFSLGALAVGILLFLPRII